MLPWFPEGSVSVIAWLSGRQSFSLSVSQSVGQVISQSDRQAVSLSGRLSVSQSDRHIVSQIDRQSVSQPCSQPGDQSVRQVFRRAFCPSVSRLQGYRLESPLYSLIQHPMKCCGKRDLWIAAGFPA